MKIIAFSLLSLFVLCNNAHAKVNIFACEPEWRALAETIGGEHVKAYSATNAFQDPHYIEARPSLIAKTRRADLLFCTGAELEIGWLPLLLRQSGNSDIQEDQPGYLLAANQVERIEVLSAEELDRSDGDVHAAGNPHVHWDPRKLVQVAESLTNRLKIIDSDHANDYQARFETFKTNWDGHIARWEKQAASLKDKKVIVYHKNWSYLLDWLNIEMVGDLEPKPGLPPTSSHLAKLLEQVRADKPDYILVSNYQDPKGAYWLSEKAGIPVLILPYTVGGSDEAKDLISLYDQVLTILTK